MQKPKPIQENLLQHQFVQTLGELFQFEKQCLSIYSKMEKKASTPELSKCLHPEQTQLASHIERLKLIKKSVGSKSTKPAILQVENPKLHSPNIQQDLEIVQTALTLQNRKLALYELLHPLAVATKLTMQAELIEQTIADNRHTNTWLRQIVQNVIPALLN